MQLLLVDFSLTNDLFSPLSSIAYVVGFLVSACFWGAAYYMVEAVPSQFSELKVPILYSVYFTLHYFGIPLNVTAYCWWTFLWKMTISLLSPPFPSSWILSARLLWRLSEFKEIIHCAEHCSKAVQRICAFLHKMQTPSLSAQLVFYQPQTSFWSVLITIFTPSPKNLYLINRIWWKKPCLTEADSWCNRKKYTEKNLWANFDELLYLKKFLVL